MRKLTLILGGLILMIIALQVAYCDEEQPRIAVIKTKDIGPFDAAVEGFKSRIKGEIHEYSMRGELETGKHIKEIIRIRKYDLILAVGVQAAITAAEIPEIPTVYCMVINPEKYGLQQKDHMAGVSPKLPAELSLNNFREVLPELWRVGIVYNPDKTGYIVDEAKAAADKLGMTIIDRPVESRSEIADALDSIWADIDALWLVPDPVVLWEDTFTYMLAEASSRKIPVLAYSNVLVEAGALASVSPNYRAMGRQAATIAKQILGGFPPSSIGLVQPRSCRMSINQKTASTLGVTIPPALMDSANIYPKEESEDETSP